MRSGASDREQVAFLKFNSDFDAIFGKPGDAPQREPAGPLVFHTMQDLARLDPNRRSRT